MVSDLTRRLDDDFSAMAERCNNRNEPLRNSRSDDSKSRKNNCDIDLLCDVSTASQGPKNPLQLSLIDNTDSNIRSTKDMGWGGEMSSICLHSSPSSSFPSAKEGKREWGCFRTLLDDALTKVVASTLASTTTSSSQKELQHQSQQSLAGIGREGKFINANHKVLNPRNPLATGSCNILQKIVQEKHIKCLVLQQNIDSKNSEIVQLQTVVDNFRESKKQEAENAKHLRIALKRACQNATSSRDEANIAEANGAALAMQVDAFEKVVQETKRASALLLQEQEEIGVGVEGMENEFIQLQANLVSHSATKQNMQQENHNLILQFRNLKNRFDETQDILENEQSERLLLKRKHIELEETAQVQESQCKGLQEELDSTQTLLVDSMSAAAESRHALKDCKQATDRMEEANRHLHKQLQKHQTTARKQEASHQIELNRAKKDHQETQLQLKNQNERFRTLKLEKLAADKRQESQAAKIFALERRLKDSINLMTTTASIPSNTRYSKANDSTSSNSTKVGCDLDFDSSTNGNHSSKTIGSFAVPRLDGKEIPRTPYLAKKCSICLKASSGLMKKCECGRKSCRFRAHATCIQRKFLGMSKSHVDSNAKPPVILCRSPTSQSTP